MIIYKGKEAICGILLTIDSLWRYKMTAEDFLTVKFEDNSKNIITKNYTSADCDDIDKFITVKLTPEETSTMSTGRGKIMAFMNDLVVIRPTEFYVREAI